MKKTKKLRAVKKEAPKLELTLAMKKGDTYSSKGDSFSEALVNLGDSRTLKLNTLGVMTIKQGGKKSELVIYPLHLRRLLGKYSSDFFKGIFERKILAKLK